MLINQRRIRSLKRLSFIKDGEKIRVGVNLSKIDKKKLNTLELGKVGEKMRFLPPIVGPISKFNAEGKDEKLKDLPMEVCDSERSWTRELVAWGHSTGRIVTDTFRTTYKRYQRKHIESMNIELFLLDSHVYGPDLEKGKDDERIIHTINLFLELFGECEILSSNFEPLIKTGKILRCNREFIKPGEFLEFRRKVMSMIDGKSKSQKLVVDKRLQFIEKLGLVGIGNGILGFRGYIALQSANKRYTIFENLNYGNATYITDMDWITFSQLDKQTILNEKIYLDRIIHDKLWENKLKKYCS